MPPAPAAAPALVAARLRPPRQFSSFPACSLPLLSLLNFTLQPCRTMLGGAPTFSALSGGNAVKPCHLKQLSRAAAELQQYASRTVQPPRLPICCGAPAVAACCASSPLLPLMLHTRRRWPGTAQLRSPSARSAALQVHGFGGRTGRQRRLVGAVGYPAAGAALPACCALGAAPTVGLWVVALAGGCVHARAAALREADVAHVLERLLRDGRVVWMRTVCGREGRVARQSSGHPPGGRHAAPPAGWPAASGWPR